jgi:hypothetical protein
MVSGQHLKALKIGIRVSQGLSRRGFWHAEKSEKRWRLPGALNKLRISGDIASFVVILRKLAAVLGTTGRPSSPSYGASDV